ncbi:MAG: MBL fold metallo-hydrolase [Bacteroidetes bacterium]|nr:MBL fold metallo-hydrolase [Bacteroidota bacterium]MBK8343613.1 MBL fold metallo-hydrolase [Bacteroidota bacterium]
MYIEQLYTNCLAEAAYYIESEGEVAIIDPLRESLPYIEMAASRNAKIKYVFETHFHADFVSGHIDLAKKTGAQIIYGPEANTNYSVINAKDGEEFSIGKIKIRALHTPGHTLESTCYLLIDETGKNHCIFTGDTLFVGDVGRPDLLDGVMTKEELASKMYDSLNTKIKTLADDVIVYPAHGPGSACGKSMGKETFSTIGIQKQTNYALQEMSRAAFIEAVTDGLSVPPQYFFEDARINKTGYTEIDEVITNNTKALTVQEVTDAMESGVLVLDTRVADVFEKGFIPGSLNIGLNGMFAVWVGTLIDINQPLVLVTDIGKEAETVLRLARVGYENVIGYLDGGMQSWISAGKKTDAVTTIQAEDIKQYYDNADYVILDVRKPSEFENEHIKNAINIQLSEIDLRAGELDADKKYIIHCAAGYRSMMAASILKEKGFNNFVNVAGGWGSIKKTSLPLEANLPELI